MANILPLAVDLVSRDGTTDQDAKMANAYGEGAIMTKRPGLSASGITTPGAGQLIACWRGRTIAITADTLVDSPQATQTADLASWTIQSGTAPTIGTTAVYHQTIKHSDGYTYVVGSGASNNSVHRSNDGITWTSRYTGGWASGSLGATRYNGAVASLNGVLYLLGGEDGTSATNHVWSSSDGGASWSQQANAGWSARIGHAAVTFNGYIYVLGGWQNRSASQSKNDVWRSSDGNTWEEVTSAAPWTACAVGATVSNGKIFTLGGANASGGSVQAWYTANGTSWTRVTDVPIANVPAFAYGGGIFISNATTAGYFSINDGTSWPAIGGTPSLYKTIAPLGQTVWFGTSGGSNYTADVTGYGASEVPISTSSPTEPFDSSQTSLAHGNNYLFFKTARDAWYYNGATVTKVSDADYPTETVPGAAYLDGYFFVMQPDGTIQNSALGDPATWSALDFLNAEMEPDDGVALAKSQNYIVAFGEWSLEVFYNAANPTGSPLTRMPNSAQWVGCASGRSLANINSQLYWLGKTYERGRQVFRLNGLQPEILSTPDVERILNVATLTTVRSFGIKIGGHSFYVLNLVSDNITLVYDAATKTWAEWTALTAGATVSVTGITQSSGMATIECAASHGLSDGQVFAISGAGQSGYNQTAIARVVDSDTLQMECDPSTVTPATGTLVLTPYTEGYFPYVGYTHCSGKDLILHESSGMIYEVGQSYYDDDGVPIHVVSRIGPVDGKVQEPKPISEVSLFAERSDSHAYIRMSSDDAQTWINARRIDLSIDRPRTRRLGAPVRAVLEFHHVDTAPLRAESLSVVVG